MIRPLSEQGSLYAKEEHAQCLTLIKQLCAIPAPSNQEEQRAQFCRAYMEGAGAHPVIVDEASNVIFPYHITENEPFTVLMAHTDTVFPDLTPFTVQEKDGFLYAPGIGDDTANLSVLLSMIKYVVKYNIPTKGGILFVANSGEEGLGNLRGCRAIMKKYEGRIKAFISLDGSYKNLCVKAVGSQRYEVEVRTEGGHSFGAFGNRNAIHLLSSMIDTLYTMKVPSKGRTTYNVGKIQGGTSVNSIAQQASMLYEYRSDDRESLQKMKTFFDAVIESYRAMDVEVDVRLLGTRPCSGDVPQKEQDALTQTVRDIIVSQGEACPTLGIGSTDCNIPLSMGIPSVCFGAYLGRGAHTYEECIETDSLKTGLRIITQLVENL